MLTQFRRIWSLEGLEIVNIFHQAVFLCPLNNVVVEAHDADSRMSCMLQFLWSTHEVAIFLTSCPLGQDEMVLELMKPSPAHFLNKCASLVAPPVNER